MRLVLIRHGETIWNARARLQGRADAALSERGRAQIAEMAPWFVEAEHVVRSPLGRTAETATLLGHPDALVDDRWVEVDVGGWTGRLLAELPEADVRAWRRGQLVPPDGEPPDVVTSRVAEAIDDLTGASHPSAVVVTHGGAIRTAVELVTGLPRGRLAPVQPASLTVVDLAASMVVAYGAPATAAALLAGAPAHTI